MYTKKLIMMFFFKKRTTLFIAILLLGVIGCAFLLSYNFSENINSNTSNINDGDQALIFANSKDPLEISYKYQEVYFIKDGQTFSNFLDQFNLNINEKVKIINLVSKEIDLKRIKIATKIEINSSKVNDKKNIDYIIIYPSKERSIYIDFALNEIKLKVDELKIFKSSKFVKVKVNNSIYQSMTEKKIPENVIM